MQVMDYIISLAQLSSFPEIQIQGEVVKSWLSEIHSLEIKLIVLPPTS